jgi:hypothetical protein
MATPSMVKFPRILVAVYTAMARSLPHAGTVAEPGNLGPW